MKEAALIPDAIQWYEGMLLAPQHFQQLAVRSEELLHYHMSLAAPFHWGIKELKIDRVLLIDGIFRILKLEAIMPDGLIATHYHDDERMLEIDLNEHVEILKKKPVLLHIVVPAAKPGMAFMKGSLPRYDSVEGKPVPDENTGDSELSIPRLRPRINLLLTDNPSRKFCSFPIAKIAYENESFTMTDFIPPALSVPIRSSIWDICTGIARKIREKAVFLSEKISSPASPVKGAKALETKLLIWNLTCGLPHFEAVVNTGVSHPYSIYLSLCSLVGNMAGLGSGTVPPILKAYDHNNIRETFRQAEDFIFGMIEKGILESHTPVSFELSDGIFSLKLKKSWITPRIIIGILKRPGASPADMEAWMEEALIGSEPVIESLREKRILGAKRKKIDSDGELVPTGGIMLFSVEADSAFIREDEILCVLNASDSLAKQGPVEIILYIKNKE